MSLTAGQVVALALEAAHSQGKAVQGQMLFNSMLNELCQTYDFAEARGQYHFLFQPQGVPPIAPGVSPPQGGTPAPSPPTQPPPDIIGGGLWNSMIWNKDPWGPIEITPQPGDDSDVWNEMAWNVGKWGPLPAAEALPGTMPTYPGNQFGSGPYILPLDYLRLSGSSGSSGSQKSFIWWLQGVPYPVIPMDLAEFDLQVQQAGLQSFVWLSASDMATPLGDRILLCTTGDVTSGSTTIDNLASTARLVGHTTLGVAGQGIVPGTMLVDFSPTAAKLSIPANETVTGASLFFGHCPVVYIYPPPHSSLQAMIRYQKRMPDIVDWTRFPWFHHDRYMVEKLTGMLCQLNDDARADALLAGPEAPASPDGKLRLFLAMKDDEPSHPKRVELDRRAFGRGWIGSTKVTKQVGW